MSRLHQAGSIPSRSFTGMSARCPTPTVMRIYTVGPNPQRLRRLPIRPTVSPAFSGPGATRTIEISCGSTEITSTRSGRRSSAHVRNHSKKATKNQRWPSSDGRFFFDTQFPQTRRQRTRKPYPTIALHSLFERPQPDWQTSPKQSSGGFLVRSRRMTQIRNHSRR